MNSLLGIFMDEQPQIKLFRVKKEKGSLKYAACYESCFLYR
ncbi:hypothetical protein PROSTU_00884 [Providencia stuartii ATCC 25827]|uniref:Uncharacterized protein n=1 Tax=Providencia stuartii ATCC 25827 TaxID=471874 RepID=A0AA86Z305_PROST|nr:hypothetical protein PROSTU_00884 [Providencia stuartii ATCC 25827]